MADKKISQLNTATTPAGTETLPIVQASETKKTTIADLTSGRVVNSIGYTISSNAIVTEAGTSKTLSASDNGKVIYCTSNSAVTINTATGLGAGFSCVVLQGGTGQITFSQGASTTLVSFANLLKSAGQYAMVSLVCPVANTFVLSGSTS